MRVTTALLSGMHSGPNPSPGLGVARSLKLARPDIRVVGIDYSPTSSGLHSDLLDETVRFPDWANVHVDTWHEQLRELLEPEGTVFIPCMDLEVRLLAGPFGSDERVLSPGKATLDAVEKPPLAVADTMGLRVAPHEFDTRREAVEEFIRRSPHGVWVKGQYYEAFKARTASEALRVGKIIEDVWDCDWHLEAHVPGQECGIGFCAVGGKLVDAIFMAKALVTPEGKTWSGQLCEVAPDLWDGLAAVVADLDWTGGGEIELIRAWDGTLTVMEVNPRFPAWIHGGSVCGANLPAALIGEGSGRNERRLHPGFTRVVEEIPVDDGIGIPAFVWGSGGGSSTAAKHPSGMSLITHRRLLPVERLSAERRSGRAGAPTATAAVERSDDFERLLRAPAESRATPYRELLVPLFSARVAALRKAVAPVGDVVLAHSVKTNPHPAVLAEAARLGLVAEAITLDELDAAVAHGMAAEHAILNGPAKWWPVRDRAACWAFFADSVAELELLRRRLDEGFELEAGVVGVRIAAPAVDSRFGIRLDDPAALDEVVPLLEDLSGRLGARWGVHFHFAESVIGPRRWQRAAAAALSFADPLADRLGSAPAVLDVGGGWHPNDLALIGPSLEYVLENGPVCTREEPARLVLEPGKLLSQPAAAIVTRVLLTGRCSKNDEIVVDAALGDLPEAPYWAHPVARHDGSRWVPLPPGKGRILGRSCMEAEVLADSLDLSGVREGDHLAFGMCGAYDLTMAYDFGRGGVPRGLEER